MEVNQLGHNGPNVSRLGLGTMSILGAGDRSDAINLVHAAIDAGVTLIDTADVYNDGEVEQVVGEAIASRRDNVTVATKVGMPMGADPLHSGGSKRWITRAVDGSLRRLGTDRIDLYQLHRPDPDTPLDETLETFSELRRVGKIRHAGSSVFPAELIVQSGWAAEQLDVPPLVSEQCPYSILVRGVESSVLPTCQEHGIGVLVWSPLNGGWLTGKYRRGASPPAGSRAARGNPFVRSDDQRKLSRVEQLATIADDAGLSLIELSLRWIQSHPAVTSTLIGPRTIEQFNTLIAAAGSDLNDDILDAIDEVVRPGEDVDPRNAGWVPAGLRKDRRRKTWREKA